MNFGSKGDVFSFKKKIFKIKFTYVTPKYENDLFQESFGDKFRHPFERSQRSTFKYLILWEPLGLKTSTVSSC